MKIPMEWLTGKKVLTAEQVRKLEPGTEVFRHQCYGRRGEHIESEVADGDGFQYAKWREYFCDLPSAQPDDRLAKIADLVKGTIDHFDLDDAMDLLYQIKEVLK